MRFLTLAIALTISYCTLAQKNIELRSVQTFNSELSDVWGYVNNGNEYALVGTYNSMVIVDVTNPDIPDPLFSVPGFGSIWRDMHVWGNHAYITNEADGGLQIVDLSDLPNSIQTTTWDADSLLKNAHNLWIDENGFLYIFGFNSYDGQIPYDNRGVLIADLNNDPENPVFINTYSDNYVHDGFVRNDTMWVAEVSAGYFSAIDISDKNNLQTLGSAETPGRFTHNVWPSDDGKTLYTTDEIEGGYIGSYDVSNLNNITELDRYRESPGTRPIPHNTHVLGNYLWTSYYTYGVNLVDATRPDNLVEVGRYSTSSFPTTATFNGCWGVYPYLPSGNILASDIEEGLFILTPTYIRACYLEGIVSDSITNASLSGINVELIGTDESASSNIVGEYKLGIADSGYYDIRVSYPGCFSKIITDVKLENGQVTNLDVLFKCSTAITGINNVEADKINFTAAPSAFNHSTNLYYSGLKEAKGLLQILDLSGKLIKEIDLNSLSGEVVIGNNLAKGMYLAILQSSDQKVIQKIQKL